MRQLSTDLGGHFERTFSYDSLGRTLTQTYARVNNLNTDRYDFKAGERTEISDERYRYEQNGGRLRKTFLNDEDLPFKECDYTYNELGYLTLVEHMLLMSRQRSMEQFTYDDRGRLKMRLKQSFRGEITRVEYHYDALNNLVKQDHFKAEKKTKFEEFLYDPDSGLLDARLSKDLSTNTITIVQYEYDFLTR